MKVTTEIKAGQIQNIQNEQTNCTQHGAQDHEIQIFQLKMIQNDSELTQTFWPDSKWRQMKCADYPGPTRPYPTLLLTILLT